MTAREMWTSFSKNKTTLWLWSCVLKNTYFWKVGRCVLLFGGIILTARELEAAHKANMAAVTHAIVPK